MDSTEASARLAELLHHPEDLDKISTYKDEFQRKKLAIDSQLREGLREQYEVTKSGTCGITDGQRTVQLIKDEMMKIDKLCAEAQTMIRDFPNINLVSQTHRNFTAVEAMRKNLEQFNTRVERVEDLLAQDDEDMNNMPNLLAVHYDLTELRNIRDDAMEQISRTEDASLQATLEDYFSRLDDVIEVFDEHIGIISLNLINIVMSENNGLVVRLAVIIEAEEKGDKRILALQDALKDHKEMATRFKSIADGSKQVRGYKEKFLKAIEVHAQQEFAKSIKEFEDDASRLEKAHKWFFTDLNVVKLGMVSLMPKKWRILQIYGKIYHQLMHDYLVRFIDDAETQQAHRLAILNFPEKYYSKMARLGFSQEDLEPHLIDNREAELVRDFKQLVVTFLDQWIDRIFAQEQKDFNERNIEGSNLDQDEYGWFRTRNLADLWRMLREQLSAAQSSGRQDVLEGSVDAMFLRLNTRQRSLQKMLDDEAAKYLAASTDIEGFQALQDWLVAIANDQIVCIDDNEEEDRLAYLSQFREALVPMVSPEYLERAEVELSAIRDGYVDLSTHCIAKFAQLIFAVDFRSVLPDFFTPKWYGATTMKQMVVTLEDYVGDYKTVLHQTLVDIFFEELADELLIRYLSCVRNKTAKFKRSDPFGEKLFSDIATVFEFFNNYQNEDVGELAKTKWRVVEFFIRLLETEKAQVPDVFAEFKMAYWDLQLSWVEAVLRSRDDFDRALLNAVKGRAALVDVTRGDETIMSKIK